LCLLNALPHGVMSMSYDIPELVETSSNLATVRLENDRMLVHVSNRSSVDSAIAALQLRIGAIGILAGVKVEYLEGYPGWKPNLDSPLLEVALGVFQREFKKEPEVKAIHAGLECGIIGERYPGMDMVSLGPQIEFPHSPDGRVRIESVNRSYSAGIEGICRPGSEFLSSRRFYRHSRRLACFHCLTNFRNQARLPTLAPILPVLLCYD